MHALLFAGSALLAQFRSYEGRTWITTQGGLQRRQQRQILFAQRGQVATDASNGLSEGRAAEAAGDFLLHFDHVAQAFRYAHKTIRRWGQVAIVAIFLEPILQSFQLLTQTSHLLPMALDHGVLLRKQRLLLDEFVSLRQLFPQQLILFSQIDQFFTVSEI